MVGWMDIMETFNHHKDLVHAYVYLWADRRLSAKVSVFKQPYYTDGLKLWIQIIVIVRKNNRLLDNVILLTIATDYTCHLSLEKLCPLHVCDVSLCVSFTQFLKQ